MSVRAIMVVHIYGRRCNMDVVHAFAKKHGLLVIEDLAEAHGVKPHPETHAVCHSFYRNKIVAGEEGGAVWFQDPKHAGLARSLRSLGFTKAHDFQHVPRGHNYRMSNLHARFILSGADGLHCIEENIKRRRQIEAWYDELCSVKWRMPPRDAPWVYDLRIPGMTVEGQREVVAELIDVGIAARHGFKPCCDQEEYKNTRMVARDHIQGTASRLASREIIYLPLHPIVTEADCVRAFRTIHRTIGG